MSIEMVQKKQGTPQKKRRGSIKRLVEKKK